MSLHKEIAFESEICAHLADHGWLYAEGDAAHYDRDLVLFLENPRQENPRRREAAR